MWYEITLEIPFCYMEPSAAGIISVIIVSYCAQFGRKVRNQDRLYASARGSQKVQQSLWQRLTEMLKQQEGFQEVSRLVDVFIVAIVSRDFRVTASVSNTDDSQVY